MNRAMLRVRGSSFSKERQVVLVIPRIFPRYIYAFATYHNDLLAIQEFFRNDRGKTSKKMPSSINYNGCREHDYGFCARLVAEPRREMKPIKSQEGLTETIGLESLSRLFDLVAP